MRRARISFYQNRHLKLFEFRFSIGPLLASTSSSFTSAPIIPLAPPPAGSAAPPPLHQQQPLAARSDPSDLLQMDAPAAADAAAPAAAAHAAFSNPFDGSSFNDPAGEWASLLSQCDFTSSNGTIQWS
ncbi:hypothetical protein PRIPAC_86076 [Pristionchus pacificus]|uniref:Uncharacterized protein n=1 Tax=Pristionchus pacificus TaxID=54126 RepID=A0A2A6BUI6_PRIPA|nr:hypothetical protein PRIPAC_86076 [Pristionchus pacificus]|eukprot:PDM69463.1 hypothetical protein PRIPAC_44559 [Pristionchus pacificus]